jgi:hypothetical protein
MTRMSCQPPFFVLMLAISIATQAKGDPRTGSPFWFGWDKGFSIIYLRVTIIRTWPDKGFSRNLGYAQNASALLKDFVKRCDFG